MTAKEKRLEKLLKGEILTKCDYQKAYEIVDVVSRYILPKFKEEKNKS